MVTLKQLKEAVDAALATNPEQTLCIVDNKQSMGPLPVLEVKAVQEGFDWDSGKFLIYPAYEEEMPTFEPDSIEAHFVKYLAGIEAQIKAEEKHSEALALYFVKCEPAKKEMVFQAIETSMELTKALKALVKAYKKLL